MSIFDTVKGHSKRKITKNFLKKHGFYADRWGGPHDRERETTTFYECIVGDDGIIPLHDTETTAIATIWYFPEDFDGYSNIRVFNSKENRTYYHGRGHVAGKLVITYEDRTWEDAEFYNERKVFDCKTHKDFMDAIDCFNIDLIRKGYEPIRY